MFQGRLSCFRRFQGRFQVFQRVSSDFKGVLCFKRYLGRSKKFQGLFSGLHEVTGVFHEIAGGFNSMGFKGGSKVHQNV